MIDQSFIVFRQHSELFRSRQAQTKTGDPVVRIESHRAEKSAQKFDAAPRIVLIRQLANAANIDTGVDELGGDLKSARGGIWILKGTSVGRNRDVEIFGDRGINR